MMFWFGAIIGFVVGVVFILAVGLVLAASEKMPANDKPPAGRTGRSCWGICGDVRRGLLA